MYLVESQIVIWLVVFLILMLYRDPERFPVPKRGSALRQQAGLAVALVALFSAAAYLSWLLDEVSAATRILIPLVIFDGAVRALMQRRIRAEAPASDR